MKKQAPDPQLPTLARYGLVGIFNTLLGQGLSLLFLKWLNMDFTAATLLGNGAGFLSSFFLHSRFTFRSPKPFVRLFPGFLLVFLVSYFVAYPAGQGLAGLLWPRLGEMLPSLGQEDLSFLIGAVLFTGLNYAANRTITFRS